MKVGSKVKNFKAEMTGKADFNLANLGSERENKDIDEYIIDYLSDNFIIQDHYWRYLGKKIDGDFTLFFLEIDVFHADQLNLF